MRLSGTKLGVSKLLAVVATVFAIGTSAGTEPHSPLMLEKAHRKPTAHISQFQKAARHKAVRQRLIRRLAGPYAQMVLAAASKAHVSPKLVAAVIQVENGGNFRGSSTRVSSAGAIGVMQLEPVTAWNTLRVNPWNARQNIDGGARYLARMLQRFHGNVRLGLMAYNAGPTAIARGGRPFAAVAYAKEVMRDVGLHQAMVIRHA